jgi:hypothetical protein
MSAPSAAGPVFIARRALWATLLNMAMGAILVALTGGNIVYQLRGGGDWAIGVMFLVLALFFFWQAWSQFRDRSPIVEVGPNGLRVPSASSEPIPWARIWHARAGGGLPFLGGNRLDFMVDPETFPRLKLGQRFMGDLVVKKRGMPNTFSLVTPQLDENANAILAAVHRYWSPRSRDQDDNENDNEEQEERRADS